MACILKNYAHTFFNPNLCQTKTLNSTIKIQRNYILHTFIYNKTIFVACIIDEAFAYYYTKIIYGVNIKISHTFRLQKKKVYKNLTLLNVIENDF